MVYLATAGEYSDYRVLGVFAREDDARLHPQADDVKEYELREKPVDLRYCYRIRWYPDYPDHADDERPVVWPNANPYEREGELEEYDGIPVSHEWQTSAIAGRDIRSLSVKGWDLAVVRKVYGEQRGKFLAEQNQL